jgi:hypothetical protein
MGSVPGVTKKADGIYTSPVRLTHDANAPLPIVFKDWGRLNDVNPQDRNALSSMVSIPCPKFTVES